MNWLQRIECLLEEAKRTNDFSHNNYVQELYYQFKEACTNKNRSLAEKLVIKMGF